MIFSCDCSVLCWTKLLTKSLFAKNSLVLLPQEKAFIIFGGVCLLLQLKIHGIQSKIFYVTATIPVSRFGGKVLAHSENSIAILKGTLDDGIKFNSDAKKSDRSCRNGVDTATGFLE